MAEELPDSIDLSPEEEAEVQRELARLVQRASDEVTEDNPEQVAEVIGDGESLLAALPLLAQGFDEDDEDDDEESPRRMKTPGKATAQDAINWISRFVGQRDNKGAFIWRLTEFKNYVGYAYCGATQLAIAEALGLDIAPSKSPARLLYCPAVVADAKAAGKWGISKNSKMGDWCLHDWNGDGVSDHITMVLVNDPSKNYITVIGGNHTDGKTNGERGVFIRTWSRDVVMGTVDRQGSYAKAATTKPKPTTSKTPAKTPAKPAVRTLKKGDKGDDVGRLQAGLMKVYKSYAAPIKNSGGADKVFGRGTEVVVMEFQRRSGLVADGIVGPKTRAALLLGGIRI